MLFTQLHLTRDAAPNKVRADNLRWRWEEGRTESEEAECEGATPKEAAVTNSTVGLQERARAQYEATTREATRWQSQKR
jgi:hypothetical protein